MVFLLNPAMRMLDRQFGERVRWWRSQPCACNDPRTGVFDRAHSVCAGTGIVREEMPVAAYKVLVTDANRRRELAHLGPFEAGSVLVSSFPGEVELAYQDWLLVPSRKAAYADVITRGAADDVLAHPFATKIERVYGQGGAIAGGYTLSVAADGTSAVRWGDGQGPAEGERYSVRYLYNPRYAVVTGAVLDRGNDGDGSRLPHRVIASPIPLHATGGG